eukprot:CAMPEP_0172357812 /NCGR_PEP_ID=MMETSP1060-20121228/2140_1 /TAXON_ID=37318 /ORGANISM="Pseudo-nitzschia pungens, Strain cf. cingulata" /LENGTH=1294 /DNA_ID=CAMNT_0013078663 /DNA_START=151 /DNA_END=4035 /DNA_ORIENTATION=+
MTQGSDESDINILSTLPAKIMLSVNKQVDPIAGPDDELPNLNSEETRDDDDRISHSSSNRNDMRIDSAQHTNDAKEELEDVRDEAEVTKQNDDIIEEDGIRRILSVETDNGNDEDDDRSTVSELTALEEEIGAEMRSDDYEFPPTEQSRSQDKNSDPHSQPQQTITHALSLQSTSVALFDGALLDEEEEDTEDDTTSHKNSDMADDHTIESKSVLDESNKNVDKAEALAKEMQRILAENLAGFSASTPTPSMDEMGGDRGQKKEADNEDVSEGNPPASPSGKNLAQIQEDLSQLNTTTSPDGIFPPNNSSAFYYSKKAILKLAVAPADSAHAINNDEHEIEGSSFHSRSTESSSSLPGSTAVPLRRQRPGFRFRRTNSTIVGDTDPSSASSTAPSLSSSQLSLPQPFQNVLGSIVIPALFLVAAVAICRHFFHPWLKVGNEHSNVWALTWTVMCITAVVAPVFALEYMLLSGLLAGTALQRALKQYPEVKQFLKDVRRIRLQVGWWYPSEVRKLRKDMEATNAEIMLKHQQQLGDDEDERALRRQISREQGHRERVQLEKSFDGERAGWVAVKEQLMAAMVAEKEKNTKIQEDMEKEQQKQMELISSKARLEADMETERSTWNATRGRLETALKTAAATLEDETKAKVLFSQIENERDEERANRESERKRFQRNIQQAEEKVVEIQQENNDKINELVEVHAAKRIELEIECKSLKEAMKSASEESKVMKNGLECQICRLKDERDADRAEMDTERSNFQQVVIELEKTKAANEELAFQIIELKDERDADRIEMDTERGVFQKLVMELEETKTEKEEMAFQIIQLYDEREADRIEMEAEEKKFQKVVAELEETKAEKEELERHISELQVGRDADKAEMEAEEKKFQKVVAELEETKAAKDDLQQEIIKFQEAQEVERAEVEVEQSTFQKLIVELQEELQSERALVDQFENYRMIVEEERTKWDSKLSSLESSLAAAESDRDDSRQQLEQTEKLLTEERVRWQTERKTFESAEIESSRVKRGLEEELLTNQSKMKTQEDSIAQLEKIISIQRSIEKSTEEKKKHMEADRGADSDTSVEYVGDFVETKGIIEPSSSNVTTGDNTCASDSSLYFSRVQRIQEIHNKEQHQLLRGLLRQHLRWQSANRHVAQLLASSRAMLEATDLSSENSEGADIFGKCLMQYTAASVSAKRYVDDLVSKTGHDDILDIQEMPSFVASDLGEDSNEASVAIVSNPWLRNAPLWEQMWSSLLMAKTSPFSICQSAVQRLCSGIFPGTGLKSSIATSSWGSMFMRSEAPKP